MGVRRRVLVLGVVAALFSTVPAESSFAAVSVGCGGLQGALNAATDGTVITLTQLCAGVEYTLPTDVQITLQGAPGAGFDGQGTVGPLLSGSNVKGTVIKGLIFRNGVSNGGAAIRIFGGSPTIRDSRFFNNSVSGIDAEGGAVLLVAGGDTTRVIGNVFGRTGSGNSSEFNGGALRIDANDDLVLRDNVFAANTSGSAGGASIESTGANVTIAGNRFVGNRATYRGGGLDLQANGRVALSNNEFRTNALDLGSGVNRAGAGLWANLFDGGSGPQLTQLNNLFVGNTIGSATEAVGAGERIFLGTSTGMTSHNDRYIRNSAASSGAIGGGIYITAAASNPNTFLFTNLVVAGNSVGPGGRGAGLFTPDDADCGSSCPIHLDFRDSTLAGNSVGSGGAGTEIWGGLEDTMDIYNSIAYTDGFNDVVGVGMGTTNYSDMCYQGAPNVGTGMICADPRLRDAAQGDVHQTASSPTIDQGYNPDTPVPVTRDYEGHARIIDGDADGIETVDMGADERRRNARISIGVRKTSERVAIGGRVRPNNKGRNVTVALYRRRGGVFRKVASKKDELDNRSRYRASFRRPAARRCKAKVTFRGSPTTAPKTKTRTFRC